jgi:hypothetical protein
MVADATPDEQFNRALEQTETAAADSPTPQVAMKSSTAYAAQNTDLGAGTGRDAQTKEKDAVTPPEAVFADRSEGLEKDSNVVTDDVVPEGDEQKELTSQVSDVVAKTAREPTHQENEASLVAPSEPSEEGKVVASGMETLGSSVSSEEVKQTFASRPSLYRGPEDQLIHARNLADVRKFWESEKVLKDLLSQRPPSPIQEEASILLVKVLSNQNRTVEAQQVLDDARVQFPASEMIQTFDLKTEGERPIQ